MRAHVGDEIELHRTWAAMMHTGAEARPHVHPAVSWVAVYYVAVPAQASGIEFWEGEGMTLRRELAGREFPRIEPDPGSLVVFPGSLWHSVPPVGAGPRVSMAFEMIWPGSSASRPRSFIA